MDREKLCDETLVHIADVQDVLEKLTIKLQDAAYRHDHTKKAHGAKLSNRFFEFAEAGFEGDWFEYHKEVEKHHLAEEYHSNLTLLDLLEHLVDNVTACNRRRGLADYKKTIISSVLLRKIFENTESMIVKIAEEENNK